MFYILSEKEVKKIKLEDIRENDVTVGFITMQELEENREEMGINRNVFNELMLEQSHFRTSVDTYDDYSFGIISIVNVMNVNEDQDRMAFVIRKNQFLMIKITDANDSCRDMFENAISRYKQGATLEKVVYSILERLLFNGNKALEMTERRIMVMEQELVDNKIDLNLNRNIFNLRNDLSLVKNYYEQLIDIGEELQENENELFNERGLSYFRIFTNKAERLCNNTQSLLESLIHLREGLDASLNYSLNKTMKVYTLVTTIFFPLTLIVGWFGMNFKHMPELSWKYGYPATAVLCVIVVTSLLILFKKKKLF